jgi:biopolymer transport protein TolQ
LPVLATVGSTAPFVGLFGTVWGIMHAFIEIAEAQNTSLAVVAPGIAEALLATGLGLLAAIPAVVFYNKFSADANRIVAGYEAFADEFATILSRQLDA